MASKLTHRVQRLEEKTGTGKWRYEIPMCCFYDDGTKKECGCFRHWTKEKFVVHDGMEEFYKKIKQPCPPMPKDALTDEEYQAMLKEQL